MCCCRSSFVFALFLVGQGVIQNFDAPHEVATLEVNAYQQPKNGADGQPLKDAKGKPVMEDVKATTQTISMGPVASQEAIKMLGTNGGGFFNANSAHPYENPTPLSNFVQMLSIFLIPAACVFAFGRMVGDMRQGWAVLAAMTLIVRRHGRRCGGRRSRRGNPLFDAARRRPDGERAAARRQHGRQGSALRHRCIGALRRDHDRCVVRRRQRDARLVHAARRRRAAAS